jgi:anthranilate phosphoribosyltransferase
VKQLLVVAGNDLQEQEMIQVMDEIMTGEATDAQIGCFITALRMKGETIDEIVGAVRVMREKATFVDTGVNTAAGEVLMDIVGTGGDGSGTFNVSTTTAFVVAGAGMVWLPQPGHVLKRGSADVPRPWGESAMPAVRSANASTVGIGFLFAPMMHGAMKYAIPAAVGIRTISLSWGP